MEIARPGRLVAGVAVAGLVLSSVAVGWLVYSYESTQVAITSVNWEILENGSSVGYACDGSCVAVPIHTTVGALLVVPLRLFGTTDPSGLTVRSVNPADGFSLIGVYPSVPALVAQSTYGTFNVTLQAPTAAGSYGFVGTIVASYG